MFNQKTPSGFGEDARELVDKSSERGLQANLTVDAVVAQTPVGRRSDDALNTSARKPWEHFGHIAFEQERIGNLNC